MIPSSIPKYVSLLLVFACHTYSQAPGQNEDPPIAGASHRVPMGAIFHVETLFRSKGNGDNRCLTWAEDDSLISATCDGNWLGVEPSYRAHLYRILGGPESFDVHDISGYPQFVWNTGNWFGYGVVSVGGVLYATVSKTPANHRSGPFEDSSS